MATIRNPYLQYRADLDVYYDTRNGEIVSREELEDPQTAKSANLQSDYAKLVSAWESELYRHNARLNDMLNMAKPSKSLESEVLCGLPPVFSPQRTSPPPPLTELERRLQNVAARYTATPRYSTGWTWPENQSHAAAGTLQRADFPKGLATAWPARRGFWSVLCYWVRRAFRLSRPSTASDGAGSREEHASPVSSRSLGDRYRDYL